MALKRLTKVTKELNVGWKTLVNHLNKNGFEVEEKPTVKVTEEMWLEILGQEEGTHVEGGVVRSGMT